MSIMSSSSMLLVSLGHIHILSYPFLSPLPSCPFHTSNSPHCAFTFLYLPIPWSHIWKKTYGYLYKSGSFHLTWWVSVSANSMMSFFFMAGQHSIICINISHFLYPLMDTYMFHNLATVNSATVRRNEHVFLLYADFVMHVWYSWIIQISTFMFLRHYHTDDCNGWTSLYPYQPCIQVL